MPGRRSPPRLKVDIQATSWGKCYRKRKKQKPTQETSQLVLSEPRYDCDWPALSCGFTAADGVLSCSTKREESNFGECSRLRAPLRLGWSRVHYSIADVRMEAPQARAGLPRASCLLLEHVNGVFILHFQLAGVLQQAQRERGKLLVFLPSQEQEICKVHLCMELFPSPRGCPCPHRTSALWPALR